MSEASVKAVAVFDRVCYKPQTALDSSDPSQRRATEYFDKGEVREIPASEFKRLTDPVIFPDGPAVAKADAKAKETEQTPESALGSTAPPITPPSLDVTTTPEGTPETPAEPDSESVAALNALKVDELTKLAKSNNVEVSSGMKKADLVDALARAGVKP